jgi:hypothetical protein
MVDTAMKFKARDQNMLHPAVRPTHPTIWALRRNVRASQDNVPPAETPPETASLYEHLFGYDPIQMLGRPKTAAPEVAENPKLNILNSQTNFMAVKLASENGSNT